MTEIRSGELKQLLQDWQGWRGKRAFPSRADFDPMNLKYILGSLSLIDVIGSPPQFRIRLHASNVVDRGGVDLTGKLIDEMQTDRREIARAHYLEALKKRAPVVRNYVDQNVDERLWNCEVLVLPLASDGTAIDMLMSAFVWTDKG